MDREKAVKLVNDLDECETGGDRINVALDALRQSHAEGRREAYSDAALTMRIYAPKQDPRGGGWFLIPTKAHDNHRWIFKQHFLAKSNEAKSKAGQEEAGK